MTQMEVQREKKLDDGLHHGVIKQIVFRTEPYSYTDVHIELADGFTVVAGYPTMLMKSSKLGLLLARFGADVIEGQSIEIEPILLEKDVEFMTITEQKGEKKYAKVIVESLKPLIKEEAIKEETVINMVQ